MVKRYKGGLMSGTEAVTSTADARGLWGTVQATQARNTGNWPALLATETPGSGSGAGFANGFMTVSNVTVTDSSYNIINDTPNISTSGGYIKVTGRGFVSGCVVYVGGVAATTTTFISSTEVRAQIAAATSNTLMVYVVNPDGSTGIKLSSLVFSGTPSWVTSETLTSQLTDVSFSIYFSATSDSTVTYSLNTGSSLPPGTSLFANGLFTGTVTGLSSDTTYSFSVTANDLENQDTARTFSVTFGIGDAYFYLTPLLLNGEANVWIRDSSTNVASTTIAIGNDTKPTAFSPYNYNWSGLFNGSSDYLTVPAGTDFAYGTGDFTVDGWIYPTSIASSGPAIWAQTVSGTNYFLVTINPADNSLNFTGTSSGGGTSIPGGSLVQLNTWNHFAVTRTSGSVRVYVNGLGGTATTNTTNFTDTSYVPTIGRYTHSGTNVSFAGYISNLRVVKGVAAFTGNFTVPTTQSTVTQSSGTNINEITTGQTVFLGLQTNRFIDANTTPKTITIAGTPQIKSFGPFAESDTTSGSAYFDGSGDYLTIADNAGMELGAGDFSFECWIYTTTNSGTGIVIDKRTASYGPLLIWRNLGNLQLYMSGNGSSWSIVNGVTMLAMNTNTWYHVAVYRVGSTVYYAINGTVATAATSALTPHNNSQTWYIGTETNGSTNPWSGWICDMRFVVGSSPYGASNFTPPTSQLTAITNTQFLSLQYRTGENNHRFVDESGQKNVITRAGNASQGSFSPFSPAGWSAYFGGTTDYTVTSSTSLFNFGTGDFSFEVWGFALSWPSIWRIINTASGFNINADTTSGAVKVDATSVDTTLSLNAWFHLVVTRQSGTLRVFLDGVLKYTAASSTNYSTTGVAYIGGLSGFTQSWHGYLSNMRVVSGSVPTLYQTSSTTISATIFTTPTSALSLSSQGQSGATVFLTNHVNRFIDGNTTPLTVTVGNTPKVQAFSPFRGSGQYVPTTHGGSTYFDGTGDYLTWPGTVIGSGAFTVEFWFYNTADYSANRQPIGVIATTGYDSALDVRIANSTTINVSQYNVANNNFTVPTMYSNSWYHVAITRNSSNQTTVFLNGTRSSTGVATISTNFTGATSSIGRIDPSNVGAWTGYISGLRIVRGTNVYDPTQTTITIPTAPPTSITGTVFLTNFTNAGIYDATGRNNFETVADAKVSNVASKFGIGSLYFDGTGDYLYAPTSTSLIYPGGLGDITVEAWVYTTSTTDQTIMFLNGNTTAYAAIRVGLYTSNAYLLVSSSGSSWAINTGAVGSAPTNQWHHIAVVRNGGTFTLYVNGSSVASSSAVGATTALMAGTQNMVGALQNSTITLPFVGYIDDLRVTRYARYTANFTPPTTAYLTR